MWKIILGVLGLVVGGLFLGAVGFIVLADFFQIDWISSGFSGVPDPRSDRLAAATFLPGAVLGSAAGVWIGAVLDRARGRRHDGGSNAEPGAAADGGGRDAGS
jgi:hypothetical protein